MLDVPLGISPGDMERKAMDTQGLKDLFNELEFKTLASRILASTKQPKEETGRLAAEESRAQSKRKSNEGPAPESGTLFGSPATATSEETETHLKTIDQVDHHYELVSDFEGVVKLSETLSGLQEFCFDTETTGLDPIESELVGIAFSWLPHQGIYVAFGQDKKEMLSWLKEIARPLSDPGIGKTGQIPAGPGRIR